MISTRGRYALRVMIDVANHSGGNYVKLDDIAKRQDISEKYLESILVLLTRGGLLEGVRGKGGGYKLTREPKDYSLFDILSLTEGTLAPVACLKDGAPECDKSANCKTLPVWKEFYKVITDYLGSKTLLELL